MSCVSASRRLVVSGLVALAALASACSAPDEPTRASERVTSSIVEPLVVPSVQPALPVLPALPARTPTSTTADEANRCWEDPGCDVAKARDLTREAVVDGSLSCAAAYEGIGMERDLPLARACFERELATAPCGSSSPSIERLLFATMLADGQAGARDEQRARSVLSTCFRDVSVAAFDGTLQRSLNELVDFCTDVGGTTSSMASCGGMAADRALRRAQAADKLVAERLDAAGRARLAAAARAWEAFARADAARAADQMRGGSYAQLLFVGDLAGTHAAREAAHVRLARGQVPRDPRAGAVLVKARAAELSQADAERRRLVAASDAAFERVLRAEGDLAKAAGLGEDDVRAHRGSLLRARVSIAGAQTVND